METGAIIGIVLAAIIGLIITGFGISALVYAIKNHCITFKSIALPTFGLIILGFVVFILVKAL